MPRCVRNFWMDAYADGRQTWIGTGPRGKNGGMSINIYQRRDGDVVEVAQIRCWEHGGELTTTIDAKVPTYEGFKMQEVCRYTTKR